MQNHMLFNFKYGNLRIQLIRKLVLVLISLVCVTINSSGQTSSVPTSDEVWPEVDVFYKIRSEFRLMALASGTRQGSSFTEGDLGINVDYFAFPVFRKISPGPDSTRGYFQWFRLGVKYDRPNQSEKNPVSTYTLRTESNTQFYPGWESLLRVRNRFDFMDKSGDVSTRYMPRITWEKDFRTTYLTFTGYVYGEYFVYFDNSPSNRFRAALGAIIKVSHLIVFETYYLYQFQHQPKVGALHVIGLTLKFYLPLKK